MRIALAIFVKTPGISPVKTRLAASIGKKNAEEFYVNSLVVTADLARILKERFSNLDIFWAIAEEKSIDENIWQDFNRVYQGVGALGVRLANVYDQLKNDYEHVCFIGADSPHIPLSFFSEGIMKIAQGPKEKFIIGNTADGGFYFFGGSQKFPRESWEKIQYSTNKTSENLCEELIKYGFVEFIKESFDIDELKDLKKYKGIDLNSDNLLIGQKSLIKWGIQFCE